MNLEKKSEEYFNQYCVQKKISLINIPNHLGYEEAENRRIYYPLIHSSLNQEPIDWDNFITAAKNCWSLGEQFFQIKFTRFIKKEKGAIDLIKDLIRDFPKEDSLIINRINDFVSKAVNIAFKNKKGNSDYSGAALLASVILSALYKNKFVDYRFNRWEKLAKQLNTKFEKKNTYGEQILEASYLGLAFTNTIIFNKLWEEKEDLWIASGICWDSSLKEKLDEEDRNEEFPEGRYKERLHKYHERNNSLVKKAKELNKKKYGKLICEVCKFNFQERYPKLGENFIEAHHTIEVSTLKAGHKSRIEDLIMLCSNCHRMIHKGKKRSLTVAELKECIAI